MIEQAKLVKIVGAGNVSCEQTTLNEYSRDMSFVNTLKPGCVIKPRNRNRNTGYIINIIKGEKEMAKMKTAKNIKTQVYETSHQ